MTTIDLNADLGETVNGVPTADDEAMFAVISSANVACGGHAGDDASMREAVERAATHAVAIGAHPAYPDPANFGRRALQISAADLRHTLDAQLAALESAGADIRYVKPHGALYHRAGADVATAMVVVASVSTLSERLGRAVPILGLGSVLEHTASAQGLPFVREAFLDRGYLSTGELVDRGAPGALLADPDEVAARAVQLVREGTVTAIDGSTISADAASLCLHGDTPAAVDMAQRVRRALAAAGYTSAAPW